MPFTSIIYDNPFDDNLIGMRYQKCTNNYHT